MMRNSLLMKQKFYKFWKEGDKMLDKILDYHPSKKYPGMTIYDYLSDFWYGLTLGPQRFILKMMWCKKFGKKIYVYSTFFKKYGYMLENGWFVPFDNSFSYGYDPDAEPVDI